MPRNIEIKARVKDVDVLRRRMEALSEAAAEVLDQSDTFFAAPNGRLKLRVLSPDACELIYYERPDRRGAKESRYILVRSEASDPLLQILTAVLDVRGVVNKRRFLYRMGRTRIHLDAVEGLGVFMELEVMLDDDQSLEEGIAIAEDLMQELGIEDADRISGAYIDLLEQGAS